MENNIAEDLLLHADKGILYKIIKNKYLQEDAFNGIVSDNSDKFELKTVVYLSSLNDCFLSEYGKTLLIQKTEKYIWKIVHRRYRNFEINYGEDLFQCGVVGVLTAIRTYNYKYSFITYSKPFIIHEMSAFIYIVMNVPSAYYARIQLKIENAYQQLEAQNEPTTAENISKLSGINKKIVKRELSVMNSFPILSLDAMQEEAD